MCFSKIAFFRALLRCRVPRFYVLHFEFGFQVLSCNLQCSVHLQSVFYLENLPSTFDERFGKFSSLARKFLIEFVYTEIVTQREFKGNSLCELSLDPSGEFAEGSDRMSTSRLRVRC